MKIKWLETERCMVGNEENDFSLFSSANDAQYLNGSSGNNKKRKENFC